MQPKRSMHKPQPNTKALWALRGFSLIELLVTMLLLAVGLLGVANLLIKGVSNSANVEYIAKANQISADMADRIRANAAYFKNNPTAPANNAYLLNSSAADNAPEKWTEAMSTATGSIALEDKKIFMTSLTKLLPMGRGKIVGDANTPNKVIITIAWQNCAGTLSATELAKCRTSPDAAFMTQVIELRI